MLQNLYEKAGVFLTENFYQRFSDLGRLNPAWSAQSHNIEIIQDIPYQNSGNPAHRLDIYRLKNTNQNLPIVFYVHGGGFRILSKESHWVMAQSFAKAGYLVFNIEYRRSNEAPFPAAIEDTMNAYLWVLKNANTYGGSLDKGVILSGDSAGGNLVTSLAVAHSFSEISHPLAENILNKSPIPRAVIPGCGLFQVSNPERLYEHTSPVFLPVLEYFAREYIGDRKVENTLAPLLDPVVFLESRKRPERPLPPFFIIAGGADPIRHDSERLHEALKNLGVESRLKVYPRRHHAFHAFLSIDPMADKAWSHTFRFLKNLDQTKDLEYTVSNDK